MAAKHIPDAHGRFFVALFSSVAFALSAYIISNIYRDADLIFFVSAIGILLLYSGLIVFFKNTSKSSLFLLDVTVLLLAFAASVNITYYNTQERKSWRTKQRQNLSPGEETYITSVVVFGYLASLTQAAVLIFVYKGAPSSAANTNRQSLCEHCSDLHTYTSAENSRFYSSAYA